MSDNSINCYQLPASPLPVLLPVECVAAVIDKPVIDKVTDSRASWMYGYIEWERQRLPVMNYSALHDPSIDQSKKRKARVVVLNPIPGAVRKTFAAIVCYGDVEQRLIGADDQLLQTVDSPKEVDRRYTEAVIQLGDEYLIIPKLAALGVAFSYF